MSSRLRHVRNKLMGDVSPRVDNYDCCVQIEQVPLRMVESVRHALRDRLSVAAAARP